jgi:DNA-binding NtrC family response regulator
MSDPHSLYFYKELFKLENKKMNSKNKHITIIDDDMEMRSMLRDFLTSEGYQISEFSNARVALNALLEKGTDLIITDLNMPEMTGLEFVRNFKPLRPNVPVILITAFGTIETAVEAMRAGVFDYVIKPFKLTEISIKAARALQIQKLQSDNEILRDEVKRSFSFSGIIGKSPGMLEVFDLVKRVSQATANVLINGESGTGKEQVARAIHRTGPRAHKAFVAINCTAIPEALMESELFGHARGSFTGAHQRKKGLFEEAEGGTLFLDEIGDMDMALQAKLLRVIQERKIRSVGDTIDRDIDVRIIAATHKDLKSAIRNNGFREDLYYRLSVIPIVIPPLRHRREDIPLLAETFLKRFSAANGARVTGFTHSALAKMMEMSWEGNVRELENWVERAVVLARGTQIDVGDLPSVSETSVEAFFGEVTSEFPTIEDLEKRYMKFILEKTGGKKEKAAQILGINRRTLYRKEREYGFIEVESNDEEAQTEDTRHSIN